MALPPIPHSVDDLTNINSFLSMIGGKLKVKEDPPSTVGSAEDDSTVKDDTPPTEEDEAQEQPDATVSNLTSGAASPSEGARAPPTTPASRPIQDYSQSEIEPMSANECMHALIGFADRAKGGLEDSKFARKTYHPKDLGTHGKSPLARKDPNQAPSREVKQSIASKTDKPVDVDEMKGKKVSFEESVLTQWKTSGPEEGTKEEVTFTNTLANSKLVSDTEPFPSFDESIADNRISTKRTDPAPSSSAASGETSVKQRFIDEGMGKTNEVGDTKAANMAGNNIPTTVAASTETPKEKVEGEVSEDRENSTYFSTWGSVAPRSTPASRIRKITLTNLPANADNSLVASLIHGGAIEIYRLTKFATNSTAHVLFTTGDAADAYYDKYPNGVEFRFQGRKYVAFVDKGAQVDVMSGVMRGYLESGASRVVRAIGVEEDWSMLALRTLAEKKGRKLEGIVDTCRDETRTVVYRFTGIQDAIHFKGELVRDDDFEGCIVQFIEDPCEKATEVHMD